jgi:peptide-methionine (S)-S-oxide reductase
LLSNFNLYRYTVAQKEAVFKAIERTEEARGRPVMTKVEAPKEFWDAEWYHQEYNNKNKIRLAMAAGVFACNNVPHGSFPGQEELKTVLGGLVFLSLVPQLVAPFDRLLAIFD